MTMSTPQPSTGVSRSSWLWTAAAAGVCALLFGSVYWTTGYSDLDIGSIGLGLYLIAVVPVIALRATRSAPYLLAAAALPAGLVTAVAVRIAVDVAQDPTSHNLWPFEIVIAGVVGVFWGLVAATLGELVLLLTGRR